MMGGLPEELLWRTVRGIQTADLFHRLPERWDETDQVLSRLEASEPAGIYLDIPRLRTVEGILSRERSSGKAVVNPGLLVRGIMIGSFIVRNETAAAD